MGKNILISCEHAGNEVPESFQPLLSKDNDVLKTHRAWDPGALEVATFLAGKLNVPLYSMLTTRLLVEMNRSIGNPELFSEFTRDAEESVKKSLLNEYYYPYRLRVQQEIETKKPIIHISIHSFTPVFNGVERSVDVGLLFDPERKQEAELCLKLQRLMQLSLSGLAIRLNEPYRGIDDGFTTWLRRKYPDDEYAGIEIEINQKFLNTPNFDSIKHSLYQSLVNLF